MKHSIFKKLSIGFVSLVCTSLLLLSVQFIHADTAENVYINDIGVDSAYPSAFFVQICTRDAQATGVGFTTTANGVNNTLTYAPTIIAGDCEKVYTWGFSYFGVEAGKTYSVVVQVTGSSTNYSESIIIPATQSATLTSSPSADSSGNLAVKVGDSITFTGSSATDSYSPVIQYWGAVLTCPTSLSATSFKCTAIATGNSDVQMIYYYKDDYDTIAYKSNIIKLSVSDSKPDLKVSSVTLDSSNYLTIQIKNEGNKDVESTTQGNTYIYIDDVLTWLYINNATTSFDRQT